MSAKFPKIYQISGGTAMGCAYAQGFGPFGDMAFMDELPEAYQKLKRDFWEVNPMKPGLAIDHYGSRWPDVLANHNPLPVAFYAQRVLDFLVANKIRFKRMSPVPMGPIRSKEMAAIPHPQYYLLESEPGISIDFEASGIVLDAEGSPAYTAQQIVGGVIRHLDPETWSGEAVFGFRNLAGGHLDLLCTQEVKDLAERENWTNIGFTRQRVKGVDPFA